jgi:glutathione S-transferase
MAAQSTEPRFVLLYHASILGRGEFVRLVLEAAGQQYAEPANESKSGAKEVYSRIDRNSTGDEDGNPPQLAPPMLKVKNAGKNGKTLVISQTANLLLYLGTELGLAGEDDVDKYYVNQFALTALDICDEIHSTHHPVSSSLYYEDQAEEAQRKAKDFRETRMPKFMGFFERVLKSNEEKGHGKYLVGSSLTYADTSFFLIVESLHYCFPKELKAREKDYPLIFTKFYPGIKEEKGIKEYLASGRRIPYSNKCLFRYYPELDRQ